MSNKITTIKVHKDTVDKLKKIMGITKTRTIENCILLLITKWNMK